MAWLVVRVRGGIHARRDIRRTMDELHLTRANHATVVPEEPSVRGMLFAAQGYLTWGETDAETVALLLARGRPSGDGKASAPEPAVVSAVLKDGLARQAGLAPLVRLPPPRGGWRSTKKPFSAGGALGYRGAAINALVRRMV